MRETLRLFGKVIVVLFCLWQMTAVGVYALPSSSTWQFVHTLQNRLGPVINPYLLITSQWQQWNLFSPDPLRRVTSYAFETPDGSDGWKEIEYLTPGSLPWWRHAAQFKMLGSLLDGNAESDTQHTMAERWLQLRCAAHGLPPGTPVRLTYRYYVLPTQYNSMTVEQWMRYVPEEYSYTGHETACSDPPAS